MTCFRKNQEHETLFFLRSLQNKKILEKCAASGKFFLNPPHTAYGPDGNIIRPAASDFYLNAAGFDRSIF